MSGRREREEPRFQIVCPCCEQMQMAFHHWQVPGFPDGRPPPGTWTRTDDYIRSKRPLIELHVVRKETDSDRGRVVVEVRCEGSLAPIFPAKEGA